MSVVSWTRLKGWPWRDSIQQGLGAYDRLAVGGLIIFGRSAVTGWLTASLAVVTFFLVNRTKVNPVFFILGAGVVGAFALRLKALLLFEMSAELVAHRGENSVGELRVTA